MEFVLILLNLQSNFCLKTTNICNKKVTSLSRTRGREKENEEQGIKKIVGDRKTSLMRSHNIFKTYSLSPLVLGDYRIGVYLLG